MCRCGCDCLCNAKLSGITRSGVLGNLRFTDSCAACASCSGCPSNRSDVCDTQSPAVDRCLASRRFHLSKQIQRAVTSTCTVVRRGRSPCVAIFKHTPLITGVLTDAPSSRDCLKSNRYRQVLIIVPCGVQTAKMVADQGRSKHGST